MAIYHLSVKPISRGKGRSATAAAAYRAAERIRDDLSGETFDYTRKRGVEHSEIVLPVEGARRELGWALDRQQLWNAAEFAERRKDARVAREYELALPHELNKGQRSELVRGFACEIALRYGVAVDFSIHRPDRGGDGRNFHAHVLASTRELTASGFGAKSSIEWSDTDRARRGMGPAKLEVSAIRERWAALANAYLKERQIEARIDHRSLEAQGLDRQPTQHLGPALSGMQRRGMESEVGRRMLAQQYEAGQRRLDEASLSGRLEKLQAEIRRAVIVLDTNLAQAIKLRNEGHQPVWIEVRRQESAENWMMGRLEEGEHSLDALFSRGRVREPEPKAYSKSGARMGKELGYGVDDD